MDCADPTEYDFAMEFLGNWEHWEVLKNARWFQPYLDSMRAELEAKLRRDAITRYATAAGKGDAMAAKWFAEGQFNKPNSKPKNPKGRPGNNQLSPAAESRRVAADEKAEREVLRRLGLLDGE